MEVVANSYLPGDQHLVDKIVYELKAQGIFDQFRKECFADVDTKPAYQNLRQRVEGSVSSFLKEQSWRPDMNKNQVREMLRKTITELGFLETGVERIVDQVVNPKINTVFLPKVEEVVYNYLGIKKPSRNEACKNEPVDLLPNDLEAVSPESEPADKKDEKSMENLQDMDETKTEEEESPPFEPLDEQSVYVPHEENSIDSHLSGFSGLISHESNQSNENKVTQMEQDSQMSRNSSDSRLSIVTSDENSKMDICEDSQSKSIKSNDSYQKSENNDKADKNKHKSSDKHKSRSESRSDRDRKSSKDSKSRHSSSSKDKDRSHDRRDSKSSSSNNKNDKVKDERVKEDKGKDDKAKDDKTKDKNDKDRGKSSSNSSSKHSSSSNSNNKEKNVKKESSSSDKHKSDKDKSRPSSSNHKDSKSRDKSSDSKPKDKSSSTDKHKHSSSSHSDRHKKDKDKKKDSKSKDDHYSSKDKKNDRRSTDRDSNDGQSSKNFPNTPSEGGSSSQSQKSSQDSGRNGGESGNSDHSETTTKAPVIITGSVENAEVTITSQETQRVKVLKPKCASNIQEALRLMKIRKQLAKLEKQNQLSLTTVNVNSSILLSSSIDLDNLKNNGLMNEKTKQKTANNKIISDLEVVPSPLQNTVISQDNWDAMEAKLREEVYSEFKEYNDDSLEDGIEDKPQCVEEKIEKKEEKIDSKKGEEDEEMDWKYFEAVDIKKIEFLQVVKEFVKKVEMLKKPSRKGKLFKRKVEDSDVKNNNKKVKLTSEFKKKATKRNKEKFNSNTEITQNEKFSLPLSPAESDKSVGKKDEAVLVPLKPKRNSVSKVNNQRYSSDDLYKPRPTFLNNSRRRGAKNLEN